jgi:hypothetical protein
MELGGPVWFITLVGLSVALAPWGTIIFRNCAMTPKQQSRIATSAAAAINYCDSLSGPQSMIETLQCIGQLLQ